jgi:hypothetical protein
VFAVVVVPPVGGVADVVPILLQPVDIRMVPRVAVTIRTAARWLNTFFIFYPAYDYFLLYNVEKRIWLGAKYKTGKANCQRNTKADYLNPG